METMLAAIGPVAALLAYYALGAASAIVMRREIRRIEAAPSRA